VASVAFRVIVPNVVVVVVVVVVAAAVVDWQCWRCEAVEASVERRAEARASVVCARRLAPAVRCRCPVDRTRRAPPYRLAD
jgi:hypothetical protein